MPVEKKVQCSCDVTDIHFLFYLRVHFIVIYDVYILLIILFIRFKVPTNCTLPFRSLMNKDLFIFLIFQKLKNVG